MVTEKVEKAWKVMAYTAKHQERLKEASHQKRSGAKLKNPVLAFSLSWHPEQKPDRNAMMEAARTSLAKLGLTDHETMIACHSDEPQPHIHLIVNKVHPRTGLVACLKHAKRKLQDWARDYQKKERTMYCPQREENYRKREEGRKTRYANPAIVKAWQNSHDAKSFVQQLAAKGYELAQGRKRLVVVDPYGKSSNPTRDLKAALGDKFKEQEFRDRLAGIEPSSLPTPEAIKERRTAEENRRNERLRAFEEKAAELIGKQAGKHHEERLSLANRHHQRIEHKRTELETFYCIGEQNVQINRLQDQLRNPGFVQRISFKLFKTDRKLERALREIEMQQTDAKRRMNEAIGTLKKERDRDFGQLERMHAQEIEELKRRLDAWRPSDRSRRVHEREHTCDLALGRDGPGLSR
ncbi:hypothetical protein HNR46_000890 [Haloferula luteola]|uniref:MobA/VirD2-like nuclease domain-containing protein n=1 Tax=Haloferula luteola TaxID=595692 RepID=A0A840UY02_9BACT|nr:hypothetical protein [Haloferula luteola]